MRLLQITKYRKTCKSRQIQVRKAVIEKLKEKNLLAKEEKHIISVPRGERSNMVIEPRLSFQFAKNKRDGC